jgi:DNA-binding response OmpR family regulator
MSGGQHPTAEAPVPGTPQARQKTIVVVDDDSQLAELMREFLSDEGYAVEVCSQGERAFATIRALLPDLIILDVRLAEIGGLAVLYLLSTTPETRQIPVLMCTAVSTGEMQPWEEVLDEKGVPILYKPFDLGRLAAQVAAML